MNTPSFGLRRPPQHKSYLGRPQRECVIELPTLHPGQVSAYRMPGRFRAVRCGRRWGKTELAKTIVGNAVAHGHLLGWFVPEYKFLSEAYSEILELLLPIRKSNSRIEGVIRCWTKGRVDFWSLENERAGRSRKYHGIVIDEAAFAKPNMTKIWETSIRPTLVDYQGWALVLSNTNGVDDTNFFYRICTDPTYGFNVYHAPTHQNPFLPAEELARLVKDNHPLVYQQEYLAEFVDWAGVAFFSGANLLENGAGVSYPSRCDSVFAVIDTAIKTGRENDATAVSYWAVNRTHGTPLVCLDWDILQVEGSLLEHWLPNVFRRTEELAKLCGARQGSLGAWIEDKGSGTILLQQSARRGWAVQPISIALTDKGKDERALSVSGYVFQNQVKFSSHAYDKLMLYKGITRNHMWSQVVGFRVGARDQADDLLDTFTYAVALTLGNADGY